MCMNLCIQKVCVFPPSWTNNLTADLSSRRVLRQMLIFVQASSRKPCYSHPMENLYPKNTHTPVRTGLTFIWNDFTTDRVQDENMSIVQNIGIHHLNTNHTRLRINIWRKILINSSNVIKYSLNMTILDEI